MIPSRPIPFVMVVLMLAAILVVSGCAHSRKSSRPPLPAAEKSEKSDSKLEVAAQKAVEKTDEDERMAPEIQRDVNAIFFKGKEENPGGLDAFSPDRIQELEIGLTQADRPAIHYYRENREFFDRVEDLGGGFRILSNAKRLVPYRGTSAGRRKLFKMDLARVKEMIANPCFSAVEDCGESASDGEENTVLLEEWVRKYSDKEYQIPREKLLRSYLATLEKYQKRVSHGVPPRSAPAGAKVPPKVSPKVGRARQSALLVGTHIRGVQMLLKE